MTEKGWTFAAWRRGAGLSNREAAKLLGVSRSTIERWNASTPEGRVVELACRAAERELEEAVA